MQQLSLQFAAFTLVAASAAAQNVGAVYTQTNDAATNNVLVFARGAGGVLGAPTAVPTQGTGLGTGLGSQSSVVLTRDGRFLLVANAGSNDVSVLSVGASGVTLVDREASRGVQPISVAERNGAVYVLNAGATANVAGFTLSVVGDLTPIAAAPAALSNSSPGPAQVAIGPGGAQVFVTEKNTNLVDVFPILPGGGLGNPNFLGSNGPTPFGFDFGKHDTLIVSEAAGGAVDASSMSSYRIGLGTLNTVTAALATTETAACWVVVTKNGRYVYTTNTGSGTVTGYSIAMPSGALNRLEFDGVSGDLGAGSHPIDAAISFDGRFLYVLSPATSEIATFRIRSDGSLEKLPSALGLPSTAYGLAAL